jgi:hypothetical protein
MRLKEIDAFSARGMTEVYGCDQWMPKTDGTAGFEYILRMRVWRTPQGQLFARFWPSKRDGEKVSWQIIGTFRPPLPPLQSDKWVPQCLREAYETWVIDELEYPSWQD